MAGCVAENLRKTNVCVPLASYNGFILFISVATRIFQAYILQTAVCQQFWCSLNKFLLLFFSPREKLKHLKNNCAGILDAVDYCTS